MAADQLGAGAAHDRTRTGAVLWRAGAAEKRSRHHDAELRHDGPGHGAVGNYRLQSVIWLGDVIHWRLAAYVPEGRGHNAGWRLFGHHSPSDVHDLSAHVCHYYSGAAHRGLRRADEVQVHGGVYGALVIAD